MKIVNPLCMKILFIPTALFLVITAAAQTVSSTEVQIKTALLAAPEYKSLTSHSPL